MARDIQLAEAVKISYAELQSKSKHALEALEKAFGNGAEALGIILISDIPNYSQTRADILPLASKLAKLPKEELEALEDAESRYMFGWSHGREFVNDKRDYGKGSFYANPTHDRPTDQADLMTAHPEYCHPNLWPSEKSMPDLREKFRAAGQLMVDVGVAVAELCDVYLGGGGKFGDLEIARLVAESRANKGRLLHYFPRDSSAFASSGGEDNWDSWCGWHVDHSLITALQSALYLDENAGEEFRDVGDGCGLYIKNRHGDRIFKVDIPSDCMAFQTGKALEILSGSRLTATPHCVRGYQGDKGGISRNTLALFLQPDWEQELKPGYKFTQFTKQVLDYHYSK